MCALCLLKDYICIKNVHPSSPLWCAFSRIYGGTPVCFLFDIIITAVAGRGPGAWGLGPGPSVRSYTVPPELIHLLLLSL